MAVTQEIAGPQGTTGRRAETTAVPAPRRRLAGRVARGAGLLAVGLLLLGMTLWAALAVCYADLHASRPRYGLAALPVAAAIAGVRFARPRRLQSLAALAPFLVVLGWYLSLRPSNDRDWSPDVERLAWAEVDGSRLTVHNVRNFDYRSETDFVPAWEDRVYDLDRLRGLDLILVYWGADAIAHAITSFAFDDGRCLAVSVETRKERGESYTALQGFFRQYELVYVVADERDVLRLRTHFRNEDVYLYRTRVGPRQARAVLMSFLDQANALRLQPEWYNALTTNCATSVLPHARAGGAKAEMSLDVLLSGHAAGQAYRNGMLDDRVPFERLREISRVNDDALAADRDPDFSAKIRARLPVPVPTSD